MALKVYNLRCSSEHAFEGWFASEPDFLSQQQSRTLRCPMCDSDQVRRVLSAPYIASTQSLAGREQADTGPRPAAMPTPEQLQALFIDMARRVAAQTEDVGARFAEEARRIHYEEVPARGIRGVTTGEEARALADEGIQVMPLPLAHLLKDPLQ